jgi:hypothetical protein
MKILTQKRGMNVFQAIQFGIQISKCVQTDGLISCKDPKQHKARSFAFF